MPFLVLASCDPFFLNSLDEVVVGFARLAVLQQGQSSALIACAAAVFAFTVQAIALLAVDAELVDILDDATNRAFLHLVGHLWCDDVLLVDAIPETADSFAWQVEPAVLHWVVVVVELAMPRPAEVALAATPNLLDWACQFAVGAVRQFGITLKTLHDSCSVHLNTAPRAVVALNGVVDRLV